MIRSSLFLALLAAACLSSLHGREAPDPARFEQAITAYEAADREQPPKKEGTLFVGASNIRLWKSLPERFKKSVVLNRGFGGSHISDVTHFADRIIKPYEPKQIYLNAGGNDLNSGKTPEQVLADFEAFVAKARSIAPRAKLSFISIPTSPARWAGVEQVKKANALIAAACQRDGSIDFINTFPLLLNEVGLPRRELFIEDQLHFSEAGYDIVTSAIRWQGAVEELVKLDAETPPPADPIVFIGSSSIVRWKSLATDFPDLPVMNRGFGGSEMFDSLTYVHRLVLPYRPRQVVVYAGGNDINNGKTPERVVADFKAFVARVHAALPHTRISVISIAGNPKRWAQVEQVRAANRMLEEFAKTDPRLQFINVFPHMLGPDGLPLPDIFVSDQLHMNEKGYAIWKGIVRPFLK